MQRPNYSKIITDINFRNNQKKFQAIKSIKRRLRAAEDDIKPLIAARMVIRVYDGRVA